MAQKILVFCGAFNPPTVAHLHAAQLAMKSTKADALVWVPSKTDYVAHVQGKSVLLGDKAKSDALAAMLYTDTGAWRAGCENEYISLYELSAPVQPKTIETLRHFQKEYPGCRFRLLVGSDKLPELETGWVNSEELLDSFGIVVLQRSSDDVQGIIGNTPFLSRHKKDIEVVSPGILEQSLSATMVRDNIQKIRAMIAETQKMVPQGTWEVVWQTLSNAP